MSSGRHTDSVCILRSHVIDLALLRGDAFDAFYAARRAALLALIENAMGKASADGSVVVPADEDDDEVGST